MEEIGRSGGVFMIIAYRVPDHWEDEPLQSVA